MKGTNYWIAEGQQVSGPFAESQLLPMWRSGKFTARALCCMEGADEWTAMSIVVNDLEAAARQPVPAFPSKPSMSVERATKIQAARWFGAGCLWPTSFVVFVLFWGKGCMLEMGPSMMKEGVTAESAIKSLLILGTVFFIMTLVFWWSANRQWQCGRCRGAIQHGAKVCPHCEVEFAKAK